MSAVPWLLGGAALGVGILLVRNRQAGADAKGSVCASVLQPLGRLLNFDIPPEACGAVDGIVGGVVNYVKDAVSGTDWEGMDRDNRALNGAVRLPYDPDLKAATPHTAEGTVLEYENGCQPFAGAPGWGKCAPGTRSMLGYGLPALGQLAGMFPGEKTIPKFDPAAQFTGRKGDPFTGTGKSERQFFIAGKKVAPCAGSDKVTRDNINATGDKPVLWCSNSTGPANTGPSPASGNVAVFGMYTDGAHDRVNIGGTGTPSSPPPGFHWVPATATVPGHWERDRAPR